MLKIRLQRVGRKNDPSFRVVLIESKRASGSGKVNEFLGFYNPRQKKLGFKKERVEYWISHGAQLSDTTKNLFSRSGLRF